MDVLDALEAAMAARASLFADLHASDTDSYRLLHGAVEGVPGLTVDRYGDVLLAQTWRDPLPGGLVEQMAARASAVLGVALEPVWNHRAREAKGRFDALHRWDARQVEGRELGLRFDATPRHRGIDPLLFLDFRAARRHLRAHAEGCTVLNLFAYTCGIGVAAAMGGATEVVNVDFATSSLEVGRDNAARNGVGDRCTFLLGDCLPVSRAFAGLPMGGRKGKPLPHVPKVDARVFDRVVLDPPRWATSAFGAVDLVRDYPSVFKPALLATAPGGCMLVTNNVAQVDEADWHDVLHRSAAKAGRPIQQLDVIRPEADFPSPDGRPPLKVAWLHV